MAGEAELKCVGDILEGECFEHKGTIYIKVPNTTGNHQHICDCLRYSDGSFQDRAFGRAVLVKPVSVKMTVDTEAN